MIQLKKNCHKLYEIGQQITQGIPINAYNELDIKRKVSRLVEVFDCKQTLPNGWKHIQTVIKVRRKGQRNQRDFDEVSYFVYSQDAKSMAEGIPGHWGVKIHSTGSKI